MADPKLYEVIIRADKQDANTIASLLENGEPAPLSVSHFEASDKNWHSTAIYDFEPDLKEIEQHIQSSLELSPNTFQLELKQVENKDWVAHVQSNLTPVEAGRFFIYGSHDKSLAKDKPFAIEINAAQAFGTAHHGTTKGCLIAIDQCAQNFSPNTILDLGTGTGILAIGASQMWPQAKIIASDIDPIAIKVAQDNSELNQANQNIDCICADGLTDEAISNSASYDLIIANILAKPLLTMADAINQVLTKDGTLILSGILQTQASDIIECYQATGLTHQSTNQYDEWVTILFNKTNA